MAGRVEFDSVFPPTNFRIKVDANAGDHVQYVLHEIIHVVLSPMFSGHVDETLEEVMVTALDGYMYAYVKKSARRFALWSDEITKKLDEDRVVLPVSQIVER
jgi:hypothetical protein